MPKISALTAGTSPAGTETFPAVKAGVTYKWTFSQVFDSIGSVQGTFIRRGASSWTASFLVGADLPNPAIADLGGVFALPYGSSAGASNGPYTTTSVLAGIDLNGNPQRAAVTGSAGPVVLQNAPTLVTPNVTSGYYLNSTVALNDASNYRILYSSDGRDAFNAGNATVSNVNLYKATTHSIASGVGTQFAQIDATGLTVTAANASALKVGPNGGTTPTFQVDGSQSSAVTGLKVTGYSLASQTVQLTVIGGNPASDTISAFYIALGNTAQHVFSSSGGNIFAAQGVASAVNFMRITAAPTLNVPILSATGSDTDVTFGFSSQAAGNINFYTGSSTLVQARVLHTASATRSVDMTGSNGGNPNIGASAGLLTLNGAHPAVILAGYALNVDFNSVADTAITLALPSGVSRWRWQSTCIHNTGTTASLTTAQYGIFTATGGGGVALVASGSSMATITSNTLNTDRNALSTGFAVNANNVFDYTTLYFRVTQAQGAAASGNVYLYVNILPS